jgi:hypothetical protein
MDSGEPQKDSSPTKGYGKRSVWQWVVIYLIVAIVLYGLIYYFFIRDTGGSGGGSLY